jgi:hypothetical protein
VVVGQPPASTADAITSPNLTKSGRTGRRGGEAAGMVRLVGRTVTGSRTGSTLRTRPIEPTGTTPVNRTRHILHSPAAAAVGWHQWGKLGRVAKKLRTRRLCRYIHFSLVRTSHQVESHFARRRPVAVGITPRGLPMRSLCALAVFGVAAFVASAADEKKPDAEKRAAPAVREVELKDAKVAAKARWDEPTVITTDDELKKAVGEDAAKAIVVDFKKEYLALFQWAGSGQDKLTHAAETKDGKTTVTTTLAPGRTRDLRQHAHLFALPVGAEWKAGK